MGSPLRSFWLGVALSAAVAVSGYALPQAAASQARQSQPAPTRKAAPAASQTATTTTTSSASSGATASKSTTIVIDPGHGGFDRGGIPGQRVPESMMNLDVALRLRDILRSNGYPVVMTRSTDVFVTLGGRCAIANQYRNAIFVCVHFNSATRRGANGIETYFYSRESLALASAIHYYVNAVAPTPNRGVRRRGFYVLRNTRIPSVLVECGFLTNPTEAQYAQNSTYRQRLAEAIARGVGARGSVGGARVVESGSSAAEHVPLQPFIDQTRMRNADVGRSHRVSKRSKSKKKSSGSSSSSSSSSSKKKKSSSSSKKKSSEE